MNKKLISLGIPILFYSLLIVFFILYLRNIDFSQLQNVNFSYSYLIIATLLGIAFRYWGAFIWFVLLQGLGATNLRSQTPQLVYVYAKSWLGRYIPGTAPWILGKIYFASKHGISKNKLAVSSLLEGGLQIVVLLVISFLLLIVDPRLNVIDGTLKVLMAVVVLAGLIVLVPKVFNYLLIIVYKTIRKKTLEKEHLATTGLVLKGAGLYIIGAIISGLSLFFIAKAIYPELGYNNLLFVMGAGNLAGAVSMLAIFAPSGIGVREGIQLVLLSLVVPTEIALIITVFTRLWSIVVDLLFFIIAKTLKFINEKTV